MGIIRNDKSPFEVYENQALGVLVAIDRADCKLIKQYYKQYKGKNEKPDDKIDGYEFIIDEEVDSLKIDFSAKKQYLIKDLSKFKG